MKHTMPNPLASKGQSVSHANVLGAAGAAAVRCEDSAGVALRLTVLSALASAVTNAASNVAAAADWSFRMGRFGIMGGRSVGLATMFHSACDPALSPEA